MALKPKISASLNNKCDKITIQEETGPYVLSTNDGGWGAPNIDTSAIVFADVQFFNTDQTPDAQASGTGTISGTTFTDVTHISGNFAVGQTLTGVGVAAGTKIVALLTGTGANNGPIYPSQDCRGPDRPLPIDHLPDDEGGAVSESSTIECSRGCLA